MSSVDGGEFSLVAIYASIETGNQDFMQHLEFWLAMSCCLEDYEIANSLEDRTND